MEKQKREIWKPFPDSPQEEALRRSEYEILFGGARGPGKTDAGLVWLTEYAHHERYRALVLRKNTEDLSDWLDRAERMYSGLKARVTRHPVPLITFPSGAKIRIGHLKDPRSIDKYLGHEYQKVLVEELTQIARESYYTKVLGSCRSTVDGLKAQIFCTTNPGNAGHLWVKKRFTAPAPWGTPFIGEDTGRSRIFIHATVDDNPILVEKDPGYITYLDNLKVNDPDLYRAWRLGDWDVFAGQFFSEFSGLKHVIRRFTPKPEIPKIAGIDWGFAAPFVILSAIVKEVHWIDPESLEEYKFNRVFVFDEDTDTKVAPKDWGTRINERRSVSEYTAMYSDPAIFNRTQDGSEAISSKIESVWEDRYKRILLTPANNDRINGWGVVRNWMSLAPDGKPYLIITDNCRYLLETIPAAVYDDKKIEDLDTEGDDHALDALRYLLVMTKWIDAKATAQRRPQPQKKYKEFVDGVNLNDFTVKSRERDWRAV